MKRSLHTLLREIRGCTICEPELPLGARPVVQCDPAARILIVGQAPGRRVHESGIPFDDPSGDRLREWLGVDRERFYDPKSFAIVPMGFCFPGMGSGGDLPPRPECAPQWRERLLAELPHVETTIVLGRYAMDYHLPQKTKSVTAAVSTWKELWPRIVPIAHPSPRNQRWFRRNAWFLDELIPKLQRRVKRLLPKAE